MSEPQTITAYIALGANLGDRHQNLHDALANLAASPGIRVLAVSPLLTYPAVGGPPDSPPYLNAAARLLTALSPQSLLQCMLAIEANMGRVRRQKWEARIIDLDLLLYGDQIIDEPGLSVPHPLMHERRFVLEPLAEIAPDAVHPKLHRTIKDLLERLQPAQEGRHWVDTGCGTNLSLQIRPEPGLLRVVVTGAFSLDGAKQLFAGILQGAALNHTPSVLVDAREVTGTPSTMDRFDYSQFIAQEATRFTSAQRMPLRFAYVMQVPLMDPGRFGETVALNRGMHVKIFEDLAEAEQWLRAS